MMVELCQTCFHLCGEITGETRDFMDDDYPQVFWAKKNLQFS